VTGSPDDREVIGASIFQSRECVRGLYTEFNVFQPRGESGVGVGHDRRRLRAHPDAYSAIHYKSLPLLLQGAIFGADSGVQRP
jgi:hypothetical protein